MVEKLKDTLPVNVYNDLPAVISGFKLDTALRLAHFLGQIDHESGGFKSKTENLYYTDAKRAAEVIFKSDFDLDKNKVISPEELKNAEKYLKNSEKMANFVYANQNGNGDEASGDGFKFRGRGLIQVTGRANYTAFDAFVADDIVANPDLVATKYALLSAGWYWSNNKLNAIADLGKGIDTVSKLTKRINGGQHGLKERISLFNHYYNKLTTDGTATV